MKPLEPYRTLADLKPGDHLCFLYGSEAEHRSVLGPFLSQGLAAGQKVVYLREASAPETIIGYLEEGGLAAGPHLSSGQLELLEAGSVYLDQGEFDPERMLDFLRGETKKALAEGYAALRVTGEMAWALRGWPGSERLGEYEVRLNDFIPGSRCLALCQYDRRAFPAALLLKVLAAHPLTIVGTEVIENIYYLPPGESLHPQAAQGRLDRWLSALLERRQAEEALRQSEIKYRTLVEHIPAITYIAALNEASTTLFVSPQVQAILGFEPVDYQADPDIWRKQLHPEDKDRVLAEVALSHATGEPFVSEYRMFARDGREVWFRDEAWVVRDADGRPLFLQGLMRDVSERRRAEEELRTYKEHLEKVVEVRTAELKKANIRLKQEIAERQKIEEALEKGAEKIKLFAYSVIHDLKNPAIGIYGVASLMLKHYRETLDDRGRKYLEQILKASEHIADLVKKIGVYIITKEVPLNIKAIDLKEILQVVREEFGAQLEVRRIRWSEPERFPEVQADGLYILRALRNLVDNALKYGGEQLSEIKVGFAETEQFVVLAVTDDGVGIPTEDTEKIFGLFQRPDASLGVEGAGLGLAIVREIAERHGGRTWVESGTERGTTFYLSLAK